MLFAMVRYVFTWDQSPRSRNWSLSCQRDLKPKLKYFNGSQLTYSLQSQGRTWAFWKSSICPRHLRNGEMSMRWCRVPGDSNWLCLRKDPAANLHQMLSNYFPSGVIFLSSEELDQSWLMASICAKKGLFTLKIWVNWISAFILAYFST